MKTILKVLVGSRAHGLHNEQSDYDWRGVYVLPTEQVLSLEGIKNHTQWIEGDIDDTSWEVGHFLKMATKCNPTILEAFLAPPEEVTEEGRMIVDLFPYVWNSTDVKNAFIGYGLNQRKKFLENKDNRKDKYAVAYLRTLYQGWQLLTTGIFTVEIARTEIGDTCKRYKAGDYGIGEMLELCLHWEEKVNKAYAGNPSKVTDIGKVNEVLVEIRSMNWSKK